MSMVFRLPQAASGPSSPIEYEWINHTDLFTYLNRRNVSQAQQWRPKNSLSNLDQQHIIKTPPHILYHLIHICGLWTEVIAKLHSSPVLFYEVSFTVVLWVELANVSSLGDKFKYWFLVGEIWLQKKDSVTAARCAPGITFKTLTCCPKTWSWVQTTFLQNLLNQFGIVGWSSG